MTSNALYVTDDARIVSLGAANITLTGTTSDPASSDIAINTGSNILGNAAMTGNITLNANTVSLANLSALTQNTILIKPRTASTAINLGGAPVGVGQLNLGDAALALLHADNDANGIGSLIVGDVVAGIGPISVNPSAVWNSNVTLQSNTGGITFAAGAHNFGAHGLSVMTGGPISVNGAITAGTDMLQTTGFTSDITLGVAGSVAASAAGDAIILASGRDFIDNNAAATSLSAPAGRWLVYSGSPSTDVFGGLVPVFQTYGCTYGGACPPLLAGHGALFRLSLPSGGGAGPVVPTTPSPAAPGPPTVTVRPPVTPDDGTISPSGNAVPPAIAAVSLERATLSQTTSLSNVDAVEVLDAPTLDGLSVETDLTIAEDDRNPEADSTAETISQPIHATHNAHNLISFTKAMQKLLDMR